MKRTGKSRFLKTILSILLVISVLLPNTAFMGIQAEAATNESLIWEFFKNEGYTNAGAAGIMGNIFMESNYIPNRLGNTSVKYSGFSDAQFTEMVDKGQITRDDFAASALFAVKDWATVPFAQYNDTKYMYGYGLCMWYHYTVKRTLYDFWKQNYWTTEDGVAKATASIGSLEVQLNYMKKDMASNKTNIIDKKSYNLKNSLSGSAGTTDPMYACNLFHDCYEKSGRSYYYKRINESIRIYNKYSNNSDIVVLTTKDASEIGDKTVSLSATFTNAGSKKITKSGYLYGTDPSSLTGKALVDSAITKTSGSLAVVKIEGLKPSTTYYYCPVAYVGEQPFYGYIKSFTTAATAKEDLLETTDPTETEDPAKEPADEQAFILKTSSATSVTSSSAGVCATYENPGSLTVTKTGYKYGTDSENLDGDVSFAANITKASGTLSVRTISGLESGTKYYYQPYAVSGDNTYYGDVKNLTTKTIENVDAPILTMPSVDEQKEEPEIEEPKVEEPEVLPTEAVISGVVAPSEIVQGKAFTIKGDITSESPITKVAVYVKDEKGSVRISKSDEPNTLTYSILDKMDRYIVFKVLEPGKYTYIIEATNAAGTKKLVSKTFTVKSNHTHAGTAVAVKKATLTANGQKAYYKCSCGKFFSDAACTKEISKPTTIYKISSVKLSTTSYVYDGKAKSPSVTVTDSKGNTIAASNYTVTKASGRINVGEYKYTIKFKGNYSGETSVTFKIIPKATTQNTPVAVKKGFTAKWTKQSSYMSKNRITGYQIRYSKTSDFKSYTTKNVSGYSATSKTITTNTSKTKYYVKVRTYMTVKNVKYYSKWSAVKTVTTK